MTSVSVTPATAPHQHPLTGNTLPGAASGPPERRFASSLQAASATSRPEPVVGPRQKGQGNGGPLDWSAIIPSGMVIGVGVKPWSVAGYAILPFGQTDPTRLLHGTTVFMSSVTSATRGPSGNAFTMGPVSSATVDGVESGWGVVYRFALHGTEHVLPDIAAFANGRGAPPHWNEKGYYQASVNFGVMFSADQLIAGGLRTAGLKLVAVPHPKATVTGAALFGVGQKLDALGNLATAWTGVAYRGEARWDRDGEFLGIFYKGQPIDLGAMADGGRRFLRGAPQRQALPPIPNFGSPALAALNYQIQLIHGASPFDLAFAADHNHGHGGMAVAIDLYKVLRTHGVLGDGERIRDTAHAGALLAELREQLADEPDRLATVMGRLANPYGLNFGDPVLKVANDNAHRNPISGLPASTPADYGTVRAIYEGRFRSAGDMQPPADQAPRRRL